MLLVSPEYFERLRRYNDEDDIDTEARNDWRLVRGLLKKNNSHPYDRCVKLREVQELFSDGLKRRRVLSNSPSTKLNSERLVVWGM
jgi:hypothetical protein